MSYVLGVGWGVLCFRSGVSYVLGVGGCLMFYGCGWVSYVLGEGGVSYF